MLSNEEMRLRYFELTGIKLSVDDPIFAIGNMTEIVLGQLIEAMQNRLMALPQALDSVLSSASVEQRQQVEATINGAFDQIKQHLQEVEQRAGRLAEETLNQRIDAHAAQVVQHLQQQLAPVAALARPINTLRQDVEAIAATAKANKSPIWPLALTSVVSCLLIVAVSMFTTTIWVNRSALQAKDAQLVQQQVALTAALKALPKHERDKAEASYQKALNAN